VLANLSESLHGVRVVTAFNRQTYNYVQHRNVVGEYRDANNASGEVNSIYGPASDGLSILGQVVLLFIGGRMVLHHQLTVGELTAFVLYLNSFFLPIQQLIQLYTTYQQGQAAVTKLRDLLATQPSVREAPDAVDLPPIVGAID